MKHTFLKAAIASMAAFSAISAMANQVTLLNSSPQHLEPIHVTYQIAYQNSGQAPVFSRPTEITLKDKEAIMVHLDPQGYQYTGLILLSVDDHKLPPSAREFGQQETCTMATDKNNPGGQIAMAYSGPNKEHGELRCATHGGVTIKG